MNAKKAAFLIIVISIVFAIAIVISSSLLAGTGYSQTVTYILIAVWWIPFIYLITASKRKSDG